MNAQNRNRHLAAIHIAAAQLQMSRDVYEAMLRRIAGVSSASTLGDDGLRAVLGELKRMGAKVRTPRRPSLDGKPTNVPQGSQGMVNKIEALLAEAERPWAYAHGMAKRMFGTTLVQWCGPDQLHKLIAALEIDKRRRAARKTEPVP